MRATVVHPWSGSLDWRTLQTQEVFLYRRVGDADRAVLGIGERQRVEVDAGDSSAFEKLTSAMRTTPDWWFGHFGYDLKNVVEILVSRNAPKEGAFPDLFWFVPRWVIELTPGVATLHAHEEDLGAGRHWLEQFLSEPAGKNIPLTDWLALTSKLSYLQRVRKLQQFIQHGDVYELNYCTERRTRLPGWDPYLGFGQLMQDLDPRHGAFFRLGDRFALCGSPERFLKFEEGMVTAQPMKGTRRRAKDPVEDDALLKELMSDAKERSENIMAVDVMRNDLSRVAASRSVEVPELCAVKTHPAVHQMVSTVQARLREGVHPVEAVKACFPMASMTGAPKVSAMRLIDAVEEMRRGLFSGSLGYFDRTGNGDLNVVIRTVEFDARTGEASLVTGSAITALSDPGQEWEECELKARSVMNALAHAD